MAIILAAGVSTALNVIAAAAMYAAVFRSGDFPNGLGENTTQVLSGWGGGMLGVLGAYIGYRFGHRTKDETHGGTTEDLGEGR